MNNSKNRKRLIWGIVLFVIGLIALFSSSGEGAGYVLFCIGMILVGLLLGALGILGNVAVIKADERNRAERAKAEEESKNLEEARRRTEEARLKAEEAKYNAQANYYEQQLNGKKQCKNCGAISEGNYCEYCGSKLD